MTEQDISAPGPFGPQKFIGTMPIPIVCFQALWLLTNPFVVVGIGGSEFLKTVLDAAGSNQARWF
jgi:hypothetical protein